MGSTYRNWIKDGLWAIAFAGLAAAIFRFGFGLGATTGLNDATPWGLWIAFKLGFVALAGGGFTLAGMVYIFHLESYRPILRRAILLALLGYGSFIVSLIFDLGLPWHIYMPIIHWQHHSVMFEIAWCVMLYFSVLVLEFSPVILEHPWFQHPIFHRILHLLHRATPALVVAGIVLSTLHQSSLGSLFLIMPHRVHPLWYSPWIPVMFFISAIAAGMMALVLEGFLAERWFGRGLRLDLLRRLGKIASFVLSIYLALRLGDLWARGVLSQALDGSWQSFLFGAEILLGGVLPIVLLNIKKVRESREGLITSAILLIAGVISQRMSLSMFTMWHPAGTSYAPSLPEVMIAFAIPAAAILVYIFFSENLAVLETEAPVHQTDPFALPQFDPLTQVHQDTSLSSFIARRAGLAVVAIALMLALMPIQSVTGGSLPDHPVIPSAGWEIIQIDGNASGYVVKFPHTAHQERLTQLMGSETAACQTCHHLNFPDDDATACSKCHADNQQPTSIFNHTLHQQALGGNASCLECHMGDHTRESTKPCQGCHETMTPKPGEATFNYQALPFPQAMHGRCKTCHEQEAIEQNRPDLALCSTCHTNQDGNADQQAFMIMLDQ